MLTTTPGLTPMMLISFYCGVLEHLWSVINHHFWYPFLHWRTSNKLSCDGLIFLCISNTPNRLQASTSACKSFLPREIYRFVPPTRPEASITHSSFIVFPHVFFLWNVCALHLAHTKSLSLSLCWNVCFINLLICISKGGLLLLSSVGWWWWWFVRHGRELLSYLLLYSPRTRPLTDDTMTVDLL